MTDWSNQLLDDLFKTDRDLPGIIPLSLNLSGEEFERSLGEFLREAEGFMAARQLSWRLEGHSADWYDTQYTRVEKVVRIIYDSVYRTFSALHIDGDRAGAAYGRLLLEALDGRAVPHSSWVLATTNYDLLGELAVTRLGAQPMNGETYPPPRRFHRVSAANINQSTLVHSVPVLHLHGCVRWVRRSQNGDDEVLALALEEHFPAMGRPLVILPDLDKLYPDPLITAIWAQFEDALSRARRVMVLGHSLNDRRLVSTLRERVQPPSRLAITYLAVYRQVGGLTSEPASHVAEVFQRRVINELPGAMLVPMMFDADVDLRSPELDSWREQSERSRRED